MKVRRRFVVARLTFHEDIFMKGQDEACNLSLCCQLSTYFCLVWVEKKNEEQNEEQDGVLNVRNYTFL
jgi:hypothetical protein